MFRDKSSRVLICTASCYLFGTVSLARADAPVPLIARYAMEPDAANPKNLKDGGPLGINGRVNDGVRFVPNGHKGHALQFTGEQDGTARVDDPKLLNRVGAPLSVCLWIKPEAWARNQGYAALLTKTSQSWIGKPFAFAIGDNANIGFVGENAGGWSEPVLKKGDWQHVAFTYAPNGDRILYINGQEANRAKAGSDLPNNDEPLIFGNENGYDYPGGYRSKYKGLMDEVNIYAAALTPEQIKADREGTLATRAATNADFVPMAQYVTLRLVRADIPLGDKPRNGHNRQFAYRSSGPDATDWPAFNLKISDKESRELWKNGAEDGTVLPCRDGEQGKNMFQLPSDPVISPGNHWLRAFKWAIWGRRFVHTTDPTARMDGATYELWTFPVKALGEGPTDIQSVTVKMDGKTIYAKKEALHSLTLLLPQNSAGHPYALTVNERPPVSFSVGIAPVKPGDPKDGFMLFSQAVPGSGAKITVAALSHPDVFPYQKEWQDDTIAVAQAKAYAQARSGADKSLVPLAANYAMTRDAKDNAKFLDSGPIKLHGKLLDGASLADGGRSGMALKLTGGKARAVVESAGLVDLLTDELSFAAWINPDELPSGDSAQIVTKRPGWWTGTPFELDLNHDGSLGFTGNDGTWEPNIRGGEPRIKPGEWTHVAFTYKAGGDEVLYVNGVPVATRKATRPLSANRDPLAFGYSQAGDFNGSHYVGFKGMIDDARIYGAALTAEQIKAEMRNELKTRSMLATTNPIPDGITYKRSADWKERVGVEVPRSPEAVYAMSLTHGMSGGFRYYAEQGPRYNGSMEEYARYLASLGLDMDFEQSSDGAFGAPNDPNSYERWLIALANNGVKGGLNNVNMNDPHQSLYSYTLADFHAPKFRDAQMVAQRFAAFPNFVGENMGADNACYSWYWDWAGPEPTKFWGEAVATLLGDDGTRTIHTPRAPGMPPDKPHEATAKTEAEFLAYIAKYDSAFRQYGYLARAVQEVRPDAILTTGSFGSSPGVGASGGYSWATAPGKAMFEGLPVLQTYDWNELPSSKPMHNEALTDRLRSYYPNKPAWALIDNFWLFFRREPMQRQFALELTRGVKAIGTQFLPNKENTGDKPGVVEAYRETAQWVHKYGGAYALTEPAPTIGILFVHEQAVSRANRAGYDGPHEGKTTEALFLCHAAGWPAKLITPEELKRGLPPSVKAILLTGLNKIDDSWRWHDGLTPDLQKFVQSGGRIICDNESVCPVPATQTALKIYSYITQSDSDLSPLLFERNKENIVALRRAMTGIAPPLAVSDAPTVWAVPTVVGDVQYLTVVNWASENGKNASQFIAPQIGTLAWTTDRPIYDVRLGRKISPEEAAKCDLTKEGFQYYACPPAEIVAPKITATAGADGWFTANVTIGAKPMRGIPVQIDIIKGNETVTLYSATGLAAKLPLKATDAPETYQLKVTELLSGLTGETSVKTGIRPVAKTAGLSAPEPNANAAALTRFAARKSVPLTVALTTEQAANPQTLTLAKKLTAYYEAQGRKAQIGKIEPNDVVLSVQPLQSVQYFPRWKTIDSDLVLLGSPQDNLLLLDQARGFLLPAAIRDLQAGQASVCVTYSPFVGDRQVVNIVANDAAGLQAGVGQIVEAKPKRENAKR